MVNISSEESWLCSCKCLVPCSVQLLRMFDPDYFKKLTKFGDPTKKSF